MSIKEALQKANSLFQQEGFDTTNGDGEILMAHVLGKLREYLHMNPEQNISTEQQELFFDLIHKRLSHVPTAQLVGRKEFYGLEFIVNKDVLIPRPETETLVEEALKIINAFPTYVNIADIGTGSGCISISLLHNSNNIFRVYATDISRTALKIAKINSERHENSIKDRLTFLRGSLLKPIGIIPIDILIANLPYLSYDEYKERPELLHEPKIALTDKHDGISLYRELFRQIQKRAQTPYYILLEIGYGQAESIRKLATELLEVKDFDIIKDLSGHDRVVIIALR